MSTKKYTELIDESEVPSIPKKTHWESVFSNVPLGKALVLRSIAPSTIRSSLKRFQAKGKFRNLLLTTRKSEKGKYVCYIVNPSKDSRE